MFLNRSIIYSALADLFHHTRNELSLSQLTHVVLVYTRILHNPALSSNFQPIFAKILISLIDTIVSKDKVPATRILVYILDTCLDRLDALNIVLEEVYASLERARNNKKDQFCDAAFIERARPVGGAAFMSEKPEDVIQGELTSFLVTRLLIGLQTRAIYSRHSSMDSVVVWQLSKRPAKSS
jgi:transformation/transcription domain-associated protein